jgi:hypothetical protein
MATPNIDTLSNNSFKQDELVPTIRGFKIASLNITNLPKHIDEFRGRLHGAFSTPGLNSALFTGLKFQSCL